MREVCMCSYCDFIHTKETVQKHEAICENNPTVIAGEQRKLWIMRHCKYHGTAFDERYEFDSCSKNGRGTGRFADDCIPCEDCVEFCIT